MTPFNIACYHSAEALPRGESPIWQDFSSGNNRQGRGRPSTTFCLIVIVVQLVHRVNSCLEKAWFVHFSRVVGVFLLLLLLLLRVVSLLRSPTVLLNRDLGRVDPTSGQGPAVDDHFLTRWCHRHGGWRQVPGSKRNWNSSSNVIAEQKITTIL